MFAVLDVHSRTSHVHSTGCSHSRTSHVYSTLLSWCRVGRIVNWTSRHSSEFILISFCLLPVVTIPLLHPQPLIPSLCRSCLDWVYLITEIAHDRLSLSYYLELFLLDCFQIHPNLLYGTIFIFDIGQDQLTRKYFTPQELKQLLSRYQVIAPLWDTSLW